MRNCRGGLRLRHCPDAPVRPPGSHVLRVRPGVPPGGTGGARAGGGRRRVGQDVEEITVEEAQSGAWK